MKFSNFFLISGLILFVLAIWAVGDYIGQQDTTEEAGRVAELTRRLNDQWFDNLVKVIKAEYWGEAERLLMQVPDERRQKVRFHAAQTAIALLRQEGNCQTAQVVALYFKFIRSKSEAPCPSDGDDPASSDAVDITKELQRLRLPPPPKEESR